MPKKILPTSKEFEEFFSLLTKETGAEKVSKIEMVELLARIKQDKKLSAYKRKQRGGETCYRYSRSPFKVILWSTYVEGKRRAREHDSGWVIIIDLREAIPILFSFQIHRTKNFFRTLKRFFDTFVEMVNKWPARCPVCNMIPTIVVVKDVLLGRAFACPRGHTMENWSLYQNLSPANKKFLESRYKNYDCYRTKVIEEGIVPTPRVFIRAGVASPNRRSSRSDSPIQSHPDDDYSQVPDKYADEYPQK